MEKQGELTDPTAGPSLIQVQFFNDALQWPKSLTWFKEISFFTFSNSRCSLINSRTTPSPTRPSRLIAFT